MSLKALKKLAKSDRFQTLYNRAKDIGTLKLFNNDSDLSKTQIWFLYFLALYSTLYSDLAMGEDYISEEIIDDNIRCEAYLLLREEKLKSKKNPKNHINKEVNTSGNVPSVIFKRK